MKIHTATKARISLCLGCLGDVDRGEDVVLGVAVGASAAVHACQTVVVFGKWTSAWDTVLSLRLVIFERDFLENSLENRQKFDSSLLEQRKIEVRDETDLFEGFLLDQFFREVAAQVLCVVD